MIPQKKCKRCGRLLYTNDYCKSCVRELQSESIEAYYKENPSPKYSTEFWKEINKIQLEDRKRRIKEYKNVDFNYGISDKLRGKLRKLLITKSIKTQGTYNELIGCSIMDLKKHLESKFTDGMSWENYGLGGWHIDHVLPCAVYDLKDPEEQRRCFHFSNLRPLWAKENFDKNDYSETTFSSDKDLNEFMITHKMPASAKTRIKTSKEGTVTYQIIFKYH